MKKVLILIAIVVAILAYPQITFADTPVYSVQRLAGNDRIDTSIAASNKGWTSADTVILDELNDYPDAIAATPLAVNLNAPILLTTGTVLDSRVISELQRLKATKVILLGGKGCLTSAIENNLDKLKISYERVGGSDRYETSTLIALRIKSDSVLVANGDNFPDALASASFAGIRQIPIILITKTLPDSVANYFKTQKPSHVIAVGGEAVVPTSLLTSNGISIETRLGGVDRYDTSAKIYAYSKDSYTSADIYMASGEDFPDAMVGTVLASKNKAPLLITTSQGIPKQIYSILTSRAGETSGSAYILGGTAVVSDADSSSIAAIVVPVPVVPVVVVPVTITPVVPVVGQKTVGIVTAATSLNLRVSANTSADVVTSIPTNSQVDVIASDTNHWYNVTYNSQTGWVFGQYLTIKTISTDQPVPTVPATVADSVLTGKTIVIDPGHGTPDTGAIGPSGTMEKDNTLAIALILESDLQADGANVIMTRTIDNSPASADFTTMNDLQDRVDVANNAKADIFVSIHNNSFTNPAVSGTATYYSSDNPQSDKSQQLADNVQDELIKYLGTSDRGVNEAPFYVIKNTNMPAILTESAFISNPDEEKKLASADFRQSIATAIVSGITDFFNNTKSDR
ncbi:MAG: N-acetylmuramoyl-L-alanine amidase [Desulfosporosinus sp.]|nr:N-acetylmuramoyl-L-alanine amidase [Desulfosporosinus sp.]